MNTFVFMRKNQKYTKEAMYQHISQWQSGVLSQQGYCKQEGLSRNTFKYWLKKFRSEKSAPTLSPQKPFIPLEVSTPIDLGISSVEPDCMTIAYPNGIQVYCPISISTSILQTLLKV